MVVEAVTELLEMICLDRPVVLVLEDLHWADESSLRAIQAILHNLAHVPLLVMVTLRPTPRTPELDVLLDECAAAGTRIMQLRSLEAADVDALVQLELGGRAGPLLSSIIDKAGGNPLWLVELIRSLTAEGWLTRDADVVEAAGDELPGTLRELVLRRLRYLPTATLDHLQLASLLGEAVSIGDLAAVARRPSVELVANLFEACRARRPDDRADAVAIRHQLVQRAI